MTVGLLLSSMTVCASAPAEPLESPAERAARSYASGVKAARAGQLETARTALLEAFDLAPEPRTAANLGLVELMAGRPRDAAEHLSYFLREARDVQPQDRQSTEELLARAKAKIGTVTLRVNVDRAEVLVDGRRVGASPFAEPVFLSPGSRRLEVRREGFTPASQVIEVAIGSTPIVELTLIPVLQSPVATAPPPRPTPADRSAPRWRTAGILGGAGLAAAGAGVGIAFSFAARAKETEAVTESDLLTHRTPAKQTICPSQGSSPGCGHLQSLLDAKNTYRNVAIAGFAVGGIGVAGALFSALWSPGRPGRSGREERAVSIVPSLDGIVVTGTF